MSKKSGGGNGREGEEDAENAKNTGEVEGADFTAAGENLMMVKETAEGDGNLLAEVMLDNATTLPDIAASVKMESKEEEWTPSNSGFLDRHHSFAATEDQGLATSR